MAVPKKKTSKSKSRSRKASAWRLDAPSRSLCPRCGNAKLPRDIYDLDRDGDRDELLVGFTDLAGNPRFVDDPDAPNLFDSAGLTGPIDLGPYEFQPVAGRPLRR